MGAIRETGVVIDVAPDGATVKISPDSESHCVVCGACGETGPGGTRLLRVKEIEGLALGAEVVVETAAVSRLTASLLLLLVPLLGLLGGAILGRWLSPSLGLGAEIGPIVGGLLLLLVTYLTVSVVDRRIRRRRGALWPRIVGPVPSSTP